VPEALWEEALHVSSSDLAPTRELLWRVGTAAYAEQQSQVALTAMRSLADTGDSAAMANVGLLLGDLGHHEDAVGVYDEVVARFGDAPEPAVREQVATALFSKGVTLGQLERPEDAVGVYDEVVARFGDAPEPAVREQVATALFSKGVTLGQLERPEDAVGPTGFGA